MGASRAKPILQTSFNLYARPHGGGDGDRFDVNTLEAGWLLGVQTGEEGAGVFRQFVGAKRHFTNRQVDDGLLIDAVLDLAGLGFGHRFSDVGGDGAGFWIWHQTTRAE